MSILTSIFSSGATALVDSVGGVLDNLTTSKEEKLEAARKIKELVANYEVQMEKYFIKNSGYQKVVKIFLGKKCPGSNK